MNYSMVLYVSGILLRLEGAFFMLPCITAMFYKETKIAVCYLIASVLCLICGGLLGLCKPKTNVIYARDGFVIVAAAWIIMSLFGALPFVMSGEIPNYIDALFETISGFTTTGASILTDVEALSHGNLMWRSFTHWLGGMGVFVFLLAVMPIIGGGTNMNLMKAESPGPSVSKLVPKVKDTAKALYYIYAVITGAEIIVLKLLGMSLFEALTTTFGTVGTGGFGVKSDSLAGYSAEIQVAVTVFMILSGVNFTMYFVIASRKFKELLHMEEVRWYFGIILTAGLFIAWNIRDYYGSVGETLRQSFFQVASIITTTGFATADFDLWPNFSKTILVFLMIVGACASSTGGGFKVSRFLLLMKSLRRELECISHPGEIRKIRLDGKVVDDETVRSANIYLSAYFVIAMISVLLVSIDGFDFTTNFTSVMATLNNIGPGLSSVGPTCNFAGFSWYVKIILMFDMLAGRLELLPLLLLLKRGMWHNPLRKSHIR